MNQNEKFKKILDSKESNHARYDCVVLFSGSKDSTHLAYVIEETKGYQENPELKAFMRRIFNENNDIRILYPFLYVGYNILEIIEELEKEYRWHNPINGVENQEYVTSGCVLTQLFSLCEKKMGFRIHEREELGAKYQNGFISSDKYESGLRFVKENLSDKIVGDRKKIIDELELQHLFYE